MSAASLPFLALKLSDDTNAPLRGVTRRGGQSSEDDEVSSGKRRIAANTATSTSGPERLMSIARELRQPSSSPTSFSNRWRDSVQTSMTYKQQIYTQERTSLQEEVDDSQAKVAAFVRRARSGGEDALAGALTPTWDVAERVVNRWQSLVVQSAALDRIIERARERHDIINNSGDFIRLRGELALAIEALAADHSSQPILLDSIADLVQAFVKQPLVSRSAFLNFILMGNPGVGKTRLAGALAAVLGKLGLLVYDQLVECGRSDFVAEYEGQTATKARNFLMGNLEKIVFLDEAYSLTTWESKGSTAERKLSAYSGEAITEIVAILSQRTGSISFIAAGYEKEMTKDFIPANPGLSRRFTYRVWLADYQPEELVNIYLTALARALSPPPPSSRLTSSVARTFFTQAALVFLTDLLDATSTNDDGRTPILNSIFSAQAGAMTILANATALLIASSGRRGEIGLSETGQETWAIGLSDIVDILGTLLMQLNGPKASEAMGELQQVGRDNGWFASGVWRIPGRAPSQPSLRTRKTR